jgi:hypothetical protein
MMPDWLFIALLLLGCMVVAWIAMVVVFWLAVVGVVGSASLAISNRANRPER